MTERADLLDSGLDGEQLADGELRELVQLARVVGDVLRSAALSPEERERIRNRALRSRRLLRLPGGVHPAALVGGAAVTMAAAAIGIAVLRGRRHAPVAA